MLISQSDSATLVKSRFKFNNRFSYNGQSIIDSQGRLWRKDTLSDTYQLISVINGITVPPLKSIVSNSLFVTCYGELIKITLVEIEEIRTPGPVKQALATSEGIDIILENGDHYCDGGDGYKLHHRGITAIWRSTTATMIITDQNRLINTSTDNITDYFDRTSTVTAIDGNIILLNQRTLLRLHPTSMSIDEELVHQSSMMSDIQIGIEQYPIIVLTSDSWLYYYCETLNCLNNIRYLCPEIDNYYVAELLNRAIFYEDALACFITDDGKVCSIRQIGEQYRIVKSDVPAELIK